MRPKSPYVDRIARLKITLDHSRHAVWRRIDMPLTASMRALHEAIQAVMRFENYHFFQFDVGPCGHETHNGMPDPHGDFIKIADARNVKLGKLVDAGVASFTYTYDFGDDWRHTIVVEAVGPADSSLDYPRFIGGADRAPPEDVGGLPGFESFLDAMADPKHPEHDQMCRWYGTAFDPKDISESEINIRIGKLARRRAIGKASFAKSKSQIS